MKIELNSIGLPENIWTFQHFAMNTNFEIFIVHPDARFAHSAAHEAFLLLDQLENELSRFKENSDVARINQLRPGESIIVSAYTFECLWLSKQLFDTTNGLFDVGQGCLYDFHKGKDRPPAPRQPGSIKNLELDERNFSVLCKEGTVSIDLGGIGKGFALDRMKMFLQEWDIEQALLHGGYSSVLGFGKIQWPLSIHHPFQKTEVVTRLLLKNKALGASGLAKGRHIVNPLTKQPLVEQRAVWVLADEAAIADALATSGLILPLDELINLSCKAGLPFEFLLITPEQILKSKEWPD